MWKAACLTLCLGVTFLGCGGEVQENAPPPKASDSEKTGVDAECLNWMKACANSCRPKPSCVANCQC